MGILGRIRTRYPDFPKNRLQRHGATVVVAIAAAAVLFGLFNGGQLVKTLLMPSHQFSRHQV